jgi:pentose-5-phosphate-3-epimerase
MLILPSLLEYSTTKLHDRILCLQRLGKQEMHLDIVCQQFAKDRSVMMSLDVGTVLSNLLFLKGQHIYLTIHLMGDADDLIKSYHFFQNYHFEPNWEYKIFTPLNMDIAFRAFEANSNVAIGSWFDLHEWSINTDFSKYKYRDVLLMTVVAGKSGQVLDNQVKNQAFELAIKNPDLQFIFDGGWNANFKTDVINVDLVSYTSYWKKFLDI